MASVDAPDGVMMDGLSHQASIPVFGDGLRRIRAAVDDDGPRTDYAAWLQRKGFGDSAELIRLQLARFDDDVRLKRYRSRPGPREQMLIERVAHVGEIGKYVEPRRGIAVDQGYELNRGFVEYARVTAQTLVDHVDELFALAPLRHLEILPAPGVHLDEILALQQMSRLDTLSLPRWGIGDAEIASLAKAPVTTNLVGLELVGNQITLDGIIMLVRLPRPSRLIAVDLTGNPCDPRDVPDYDEDRKVRFEPTEDGRLLEDFLKTTIRWLHPGELRGSDRYHLRLLAPPHTAESELKLTVPVGPWAVGTEPVRFVKSEPWVSPSSFVQEAAPDSPPLGKTLPDFLTAWQDFKKHH